MAQYIIPGIFAVVVAIIEAVAIRDRKRAEKEKAHQAEREKAREELMILLVESTGAAIALAEATGHAMQRGHTNGDMEAALEYAASVKHKQKTFLTRQGVHAIQD